MSSCDHHPSRTYPARPTTTLHPPRQRLRSNDACGQKPTVQLRLHPERNRDCTNAASFAYQVHNRPPVFSTLEVLNGQLSQFSAAKTAAQEKGEHGPVTFSLDCVAIRGLPKGRCLRSREPIPEPGAQLSGSLHSM